jgi:signal recognition particle receptor subunit beta
LNINKPTHLKIILKKIGRRFKNIPIGIVVTKAHSPTTPPATKIITASKGGNKMLSSIPINGQTYAENLR